MAKSYNIIISAIIAFSIYILIILAFILYLQKPTIKKYQAKNDNTIIELEIITNQVPIKKKIPIKEIKKNIIKKEIKVEKSSSVSATKKTNLKSLFAKVSIKSQKIKEKKVLNVKNNTVSSRFKSKLKEEKNRSELKIKNTAIAKKDKTINLNNKEEFDEYYSKISSIILSRWYNYPLLTKNEYIVKVQININSKGQFSYNIISYSQDLNVDNAVKEFLNTQTKEIYPQTKDKKNKDILINFINEKE